MFLISKDYWEVTGTEHKGKGVFAKKEIAQGRLIGDYVGKLIHLKDIDFEKEKQNMYLMHYNSLFGIYPDLDKSGVHLLNHSCSPNSWIAKLSGHTIVFALRNIKKGEEITISYLLPPATNCRDCIHMCLCDSDTCTGTMHLTEYEYNKWQNFQKKENKTKKLNTEKHELKPLEKYPQKIAQNFLNRIIQLEIC